MLATAAAVGAALRRRTDGVSQGTDTTAPVLNVGTLTPTARAAAQRESATAAPSTSTGNNGWFTQRPRRCSTVTATDDVAVTKLQYSTDAGANWLDMAITPGPSVSGTRRSPARATTPCATAPSTPPATSSPGAAAGNDAQPGVRRRRDRGPAAVHQRPRRRRHAGHRHGRQRRDGQDRHDPDARAGLAEPERHADGRADEGARGRHRRQVVPAVPRPSTSRSTRTPPTATCPGLGRQQPRRPRRGADHADPHRSDAAAPAAPPCAIRGSTARGSTRCRWTPSQLSLGKHTWTLGLTDVAGNGNKVTFTFLVTTSFADIDALLARYGTAGTIPAATVTSLRASLAAAKASADAGDKAAAVSAWRRSSRRSAAASPIRSAEPARHRRPGRHAPGRAASRTPRLRPTSASRRTRYPGQPRHPYVTPAMPTAQRQRRRSRSS